MILPELRQGPWDMEATGVLGLAHRQDEGDEGNGGCEMGVLGRGDPSAERAYELVFEPGLTQGMASWGMLGSGC